MAKECWILGLTKLSGRVEVGVFSSGHVLPKGVVLQILLTSASKEEVERARSHFGDERLVQLWDELFQIMVDPEGTPHIVALRDDDDDAGW